MARLPNLPETPDQGGLNTRAAIFFLLYEIYNYLIIKDYIK